MPATKKQKSRATTVQLRFKGVRDVGDAGAQDNDYAQDAINGDFVATDSGGSVVARPRFSRINSSQSTATSGGTNEFLAIHGIEATDGTVYLFTVQGGKVSRQSSATALTDVTPVGPTLTDHARHYAVSYNGEIIFGDNTARPWRATSLGSSPITGTNIQYNTAADAWTTRGQPTVYGGKVFFVVKSVSSTNYQSRIAWSEELDAATGYAQDGYTNFWDVVPTTTDRIQQIIGTNVALYYFRSYSIGAISGAVNTDFATSSTHDAVSQEIGILANCAPLLAKGYIWFLDADGLPHRFAVGSRNIEPLWEQMRQRIRKIKATSLDANGYLVDFPYLAYWHDRNKVVMLFLRDSSATGDASKNLYVFDADTGNYEGRWQVEQTSQDTTEPPTAAAYIDSVVSAPIPTAASGYTGAYSLVVGGDSGNSSGSFGYLRRQTLHKQQLFGDNSGAMHMSLTTMLTPDEDDIEFVADEVTVSAVPDNATLSLDTYTPYGSTLAATATGMTGSDSIQSSHDHGIYRYGVMDIGRWQRRVFHWNVPAGSTPYAIERASVHVTPTPVTGYTK